MNRWGRVQFGLLLAGASVCAALHAAVAGEVDLSYGPRGNRFEGIKSRPVSGNHVELLSARIEARESVENSLLGNELGIRFFLDSPADVRVTVREIEYKTYYWLDQVKPGVPWRSRAINHFRWPAEEVVAQLRQKGLQLANLGVLVRLGDYPAPSIEERVAPANLLSASSPPQRGTYLFTFRLRDAGYVESALYRQGQASPIMKQKVPNQPGGRAFTVRWDPANKTPDGPYRLVLNGYFLDNNDPFSQTVSFHHTAAATAP